MCSYMAQKLVCAVWRCARLGILRLSPAYCCGVWLSKVLFLNGSKNKCVDEIIKTFCTMFHIGVHLKYVNFRFFLQNHHVYLSLATETLSWRGMMEDAFFERYSSIIDDNVYK